LDGYGTWEAITAVSSLSSIFLVPINGTLLWKISGAYAVQDMAGVKTLVRLGIGVVGLLFAVVVTIAWVLRQQSVDLLNIPLDLKVATLGILPCMVGIFLLSGVTDTIGALISSFQKAGITTVIQSLGLIVNTATAIACLYVNMALWGLVIGQAVGFLFTLAGLYIVARKYCRGVSLMPAFPRNAVTRQMYTYTGFLLIGSTSAALRSQTDRIVLASFASPAWVGFYSIGAKVASLIMEVSNFFYVPMITAVGAMHAGGDSEGIKRLYSKMMLIVSVFAGAMVVVVAGLHGRLLSLWIGKAVAEVTPILYLLIFGTAFAVILTGPGTCVCRGIGRVGIETAYVGANLLLNFGLKILFIVLFGAIGTVMASGISWAITSVLFLVILHRNIDLPLGPTYQATRAIAAVAVAVFILAHWPAWFPVGSGRLEVAILGCLAGIPAIALFGILLILFRALSLSNIHRVFVWSKARILA
jgi:O-antigen/teichoic acid export membrane protein